jgi:tyrosine-protein phosphatase SIW14
MTLRAGIVWLALASLPVFAADPAGVGNFHQVSGTLYRGAQPTDEGFQNLAKLGVKTVIDLRGSEHSMADEKRVVEADGMRYVSIPMRGLHRPTEDQIGAALKVIEDPKSGPVFVHCRRGADRTGAVIACYRITHDKWDNERAFEEAVDDGMSPFQLAIRHFVKTFSATALPGLPALP